MHSHHYETLATHQLTPTYPTPLAVYIATILYIASTCVLESGDNQHAVAFQQLPPGAWHQLLSESTGELLQPGWALHNAWDFDHLSINTFGWLPKALQLDASLRFKAWDSVTLFTPHTMVTVAVEDHGYSVSAHVVLVDRSTGHVEATDATFPLRLGLWEARHAPSPVRGDTVLKADNMWIRLITPSHGQHRVLAAAAPQLYQRRGAVMHVTLDSGAPGAAAPPPITACTSPSSTKTGSNL